MLGQRPIDRHAFTEETAGSRASIVVAAPWIRARRHPPPPRPSRLARLLPKGENSPKLDHGPTRPYVARVASFCQWEFTHNSNHRRIRPQPHTDTNARSYHKAAPYAWD